MEAGEIQLWMLISVCLIHVSLQGEYQRKLYKELMKNYNPLERPVANDSHPLTVYFGMNLMQIMDVLPTTLYATVSGAFGKYNLPCKKQALQWFMENHKVMKEINLWHDVPALLNADLTILLFKCQFHYLASIASTSEFACAPSPLHRGGLGIQSGPGKKGKCGPMLQTDPN